MFNRSGFDVIIIGAGPAGLSAARTAARSGCKTLLFEELAQAGDLGHPCSGVIAPLPGFIRGQRQKDGLHFPEIDLTLPWSLVLGSPSRQRYVSPSGIAFQAIFPAGDNFPIAAIDKSGVLRLMAEKAAAAGAELCFGTPVTHLIKQGGYVTGVRTRRGEFFAKVVISAEGVSRRFTEEAGLYDTVITRKSYAFIVSEILDAPAVTSDDVGQISTLGKRYTSASTPVFGTVVLPTRGRAEVYFSVFADQPQIHPDESLWYYLQEYKQHDPRISGLLEGATAIHRAGTRMVLMPIPPRVVGDGFIGVGDSVGPGGHVGILPCLFLGQKAAQTAVQAVRSGDISRRGLANYERLYLGPFSRGLDTESRIITGLTNMNDNELDRLCQTLSQINLAPFFFGKWQPMLAETLRWIVKALPFILRDWRLINRMMSGKGVG
ncbi:MAG: NAD(P)/FAD-dependent oxidoreductase [Termitinemataceae bacterium]